MVNELLQDLENDEDFNELSKDLIIFLLAAFDTSAHSLTSAIYALH